ncbi:helix-turn-helix transcriptional regulator [Tropicimonas sp. IMCC34043]|uniref:helix-turn-helix transcriptional regulator n=1 Tax=Tropicimonas sp. IMCC34043 TaxID=2248760 RepID=UPI000E22A6D7|nr:helix-turn-helix transcriptional regulator [Tropicimonas sp. IMCC34043]
MIALIATQVFCAAFYVVDSISDMTSGTASDPTWHLGVEGIAALTLCVAIALEMRYLGWLLRRKAHLEHSVSIASAAVHDVIESHFDGWKLTPAERDVAMLMVKGLSNVEIAQIRGSAEGTVKSQLNAVYRKSGTTGRGEFLSQIIDGMMG